MNTNKQLDEILKQFCSEYGDVLILKNAHKEWEGGPSHMVRQLNQTKDTIKELMLELIGEDEEAPHGDHYYLDRNQLRAELRKKVEEL